MAGGPHGDAPRLVQELGPLLDDLKESDLRLSMSLVLHALAAELFQSWGLEPSTVNTLRLSRLAEAEPSHPVRSVTLRLEQLIVGRVARSATESPREVDRFTAAHCLGQALDLLMAASRWSGRKRVGSYFTPAVVATDLAQRGARALSAGSSTDPPPAVLDPACGGGAFLIEAARTLLPPDVESAPQRRVDVVRRLHGVDLSDLALAVCEASLTLLAGCALPELGQQLVLGDALISPADSPTAEGLELTPHPLDWQEVFVERWPNAGPVGSPSVGPFAPRASDEPQGGFDWVVGNPPWVAFQGRATQKISSALRRHYRERYAAFTGYATLHGMFVERALQLAPEGVLSLLLPSSLSDLDGYRAVRRCVRTSHELQEPLPEYGQDAFAGVVQPCFGLVARARPRGAARTLAADVALDGPWRLEERSHQGRAAATLVVPPVFSRLAELPLLPPATFGELGFQSNGAVVRELLFKGEQPSPPFSQPLLEGRRVQQFLCGDARLFLHADEAELRKRGARFRGPEVYRAVDFLVRQTAAFPIAAISTGLAFRNSLIAGYAGHFDPHLVVALLNSALIRSLHLSRTRDARQAAFPQVKLSHLRALPAPPNRPELCTRITALSRQISQVGEFSAEQRRELDALVFSLFEVEREEAQAVRSFLEQRAPKALQPR